MTLDLNFLSIHRSKQAFKSIWGIRSWRRAGGFTEGGFSASRGWLRQFLLLKVVTVLLFPHIAGLPLLCSTFSLRALLLLHSPHTSTKPSTVLLGQLALTDSLILLHWVHRLGGALAGWLEEPGCEIETFLVKGGQPVWWTEAVSVLCEQLPDAHHLASLLLLGLLGLEATLVSRWPQQTRRFRTSHWAQLSCSLVWMFVLLEQMFSLHLKLMQDCRPLIFSSALQNTQTSPLDLWPLFSLPAFSSCLRRTLWLLNLWLHYAVLFSKPQKRKSLFH